MDPMFRAATATLMLLTILGFLIDPPLIDPITGELVKAGILYAGLFALREICGSCLMAYRALRAWLEETGRKEP